METSEKFTIPALFKKEEPSAAALFEVLFDVAERYPNMTMAEYAKHLKSNLQRETLKRVQDAEKNQFGTGGENEKV